MSKYTREIGEKIAEIVAGGTPAKYAAQCCGIHENTFIRWMESNGEFANLIAQKRAEAIQERVDIIKEAARGKDGKGGQWTAAAWWLERQKHEDFGQRPDRKDINIKLEVRDCTKD